MNILFTITAYMPSIGGAQIHAHQLAQMLQKLNKLQVVSHWDTSRTDWLEGTTLFTRSLSCDYVVDGINVNLIAIDFKTKLIIAPFVLAYYPFMDLALPVLSKNLEKYFGRYVGNFDLIHNFRIGREPITLASLNMARKNNIPFVFTPFHHPRWSGWLYRHYHKIYREADALIALTEVEKQILLGFGVDERKVHVTGHGPVLSTNANGDRFREKYNIGSDPFVLFLGQKYRYKGVEALLKSSPMVWKRFPETRFVFIGPRTLYSKKLFSEFEDKRFIEIDTIDLQSKTDALDACTLLCLPSTQESFGGVFTEAWSFSKPVIGCKIPSVSEVVQNGEDGLLTEQDPMSISDCILALLSNPNQAAHLGENGRNKVESQFSWDQITRKTEDIYKNLFISS